ncbi:MAG: hypothetical protein MUF42_06040 [Cytophagaceae bacterium]|nr:hypothetical protein [Cytophagaceae bacterium]
MKNKPYIVRAYRLSQEMMPHIRIAMETKELAISLAEVLLEEKDIHFVTVINHRSNEEVISFKKELVLR